MLNVSASSRDVHHPRAFLFAIMSSCIKIR